MSINNKRIILDTIIDKKIISIFNKESIFRLKCIKENLIISLQYERLNPFYKPASYHIIDVINGIIAQKKLIERKECVSFSKIKGTNS